MARNLERERLLAGKLGCIGFWKDRTGWRGEWVIMGRGNNDKMEGFKKIMFMAAGKLRKNNDQLKTDTALCIEAEMIEFRVI